MIKINFNICSSFFLFSKKFTKKIPKNEDNKVIVMIFVVNTTKSYQTIDTES